MGIFSDEHQGTVEIYWRQSRTILQALRGSSQCYTDFFGALQALEKQKNPSAPLMTLSTTFHGMADLFQNRLAQLYEFMREFSSEIEDLSALNEGDLRILSGQLTGLGYRISYDTEDPLQNLRNVINTLKSDIIQLSEGCSDPRNVGNEHLDKGASGINLSFLQDLRQRHLPMWDAIKVCQRKIETLFGVQQEDDDDQNSRILGEWPNLLLQANALLENPALLDDHKAHDVLKEITGKIWCAIQGLNL